MALPVRLLKDRPDRAGSETTLARAAPWALIFLLTSANPDE
jgi:hypothetical protein